MDIPQLWDLGEDTGAPLDESEELARAYDAEVGMADRLHLEPGDAVLAIETDRGVLLTPYDPDTDRALQAAAQVARKYRNVLRQLAT